MKNSIDREIWRLLWPVLLLTLAQKLGSAFEGILVSVNSSQELAVMGICGPYITIITTVSYGLGIAANAATGRAYADRSWEASHKACVRAFLLLTLISGLAMSLLAGALLYPAFAGLSDMRNLGYLYMLPYLIGSPALLLYSLLVSCTRGLGDTKSGMYMTFISVPAQLIVSYMCYNAFGLPGIGWGTLISRLAACAYGAKRFKAMLPDTAGDAPLPKGALNGFAAIALPVSLSKAVSPTGNALINSLMLSFSPLLVSVKGLGGRLEPFFYLPAMAMCSVTVTVISRERDKAAIGQLCRRLCLWSTLPAVCLTAAAGIFSGGIWGLLTPDPELAAAGMAYWSICLWAYPMIAMEMTLASVLQALGSGFPTLA
ncbi:MAG: MATE family efflux transporter, partial [Eubacteriales bacterium]|nr:MATE family efflux transporter [Eubacteriales bacterium]